MKITEVSVDNVQVEFRGLTLDLTLYGVVSTGGSNRYGSDEPEWADVEHIEIINPRTGKPVTDKLSEELTKLYDEFFVDTLVEQVY